MKSHQIRVPAKGTDEANRPHNKHCNGIKTDVRFDIDTFEVIRTQALEGGVSFAAQVRQLVGRGLKVLG